MQGNAMISKPLTDIQLADLRNLLGNVREGKAIEYKQAMPAKTDKEVIQFLSAVSAFANTAGGDLLIGISSDDDLASGIPGIPLAALTAKSFAWNSFSPTI